MKTAVTGSTGLIGSALVRALRRDGDEVVRLVRRLPSADDEARWDPASGAVDLDALAGVEAVVHLAGAGVGDRRWSEAYKNQILNSRVDGTAAIANAVTKLDPPPKVLVCASAVGFYGDTGGRSVDELAPSGAGFLAHVVREWEAAADPAREAGIRVVHARSGIVAAPTQAIAGGLVDIARIATGGRAAGGGGAFGLLIPVVRVGAGGRLGSGRQWWSLISLDDEIAALRFLIECDRADGPANLTSVCAPNGDVVRELGRLLHRPTLLPVPSFALRLVLGELSTEVLGSVRAEPARLKELGFEFRHRSLAAVLSSAVGPSTTAE